MPVQTSTRGALDAVVQAKYNVFFLFFIPPYKYNKKMWRKTCFLTIFVIDHQEE